MVKMGTVWDRTVEFLGERLGAILPVALLAFFAPALVTINLDVMIRQSPPTLALMLSGVELLLALVSFWGSLAVIALTIQGPGENAVHLAWRRLPAALVLAVAMVLALILLCLPVLGVLIAAGADLAAIAAGAGGSLHAGVAWFVALYLLFGIVVTFWVSARLAPANAALVHAGSAIEAVKRSWRLTRGYALRLVGVLILFAIVAAVSRLAASTVFGSVFALLIGNDSDGLSLSTMLTSIVTAAVQAAFMVLLAVFQGKLYVALMADEQHRGGAIAA